MGYQHFHIVNHRVGVINKHSAHQMVAQERNNYMLLGSDVVPFLIHPHSRLTFLIAGQN